MNEKRETPPWKTSATQQLAEVGKPYAPTHREKPEIYLNVPFAESLYLELNKIADSYLAGREKSSCSKEKGELLKQIALSILDFSIFENNEKKSALDTGDFKVLILAISESASEYRIRWHSKMEKRGDFTAAMRRSDIKNSYDLKPSELVSELISHGYITVVRADKVTQYLELTRKAYELVNS